MVPEQRPILLLLLEIYNAITLEDSPGVIGIPETCSPSRVDTKLTALLTKHGPHYFRGRIRSLSAEDVKKQ